MKKIFVLCFVVVLLFVGVVQAAPTTFDFTIDDFFGQFAKRLKIENLGVTKDSLNYEEVQDEDKIASRTYSWVMKEDFLMIFTESIDTGNIEKISTTTSTLEDGLAMLSTGIIMTLNPKIDQKESAEIVLELITEATATGFCSKDIGDITYSYTIQDKTHTFMAFPAG